MLPNRYYQEKDIIIKLTSPTKQATVYLRITYSGNETKFLKNKVIHTIIRTFGADNLRINLFIRKHLNGMLVPILKSIILYIN